jgi:hypothetical protein
LDAVESIGKWKWIWAGHSFWWFFIYFF